MMDCAQSGDYAKAAALRDELCSAQLEDEAKVLQANVEFYAPWRTKKKGRKKNKNKNTAAAAAVFLMSNLQFQMPRNFE